MIKALLAVAATRVIIDARTNQLSIIDVFEGFKSQSFPVVIPNIAFLFYLQKDGEESDRHEMTLKYSIDDKMALEVPIGVDFQQSNTTRAILGIEGFVLSKAGEMKIELLSDQKVIGKLEFPIEQLDIPAPQVQTK